MYLTLKTVHVAAIFLSLSGLIVRAIWMQRGSLLLQRKIVRILPHVIDTVLLVSGVGLVYSLQLSVLDNPWLLSKIVALVVYIGLAAIALRPGRSKSIQTRAFIGALLAFTYIVGTGVMKSAASWFACL